MTRKMRIRSTVAALALVSSLVIGPVAGYAQSGTLRLQVPFAFHAGSQTLPPGVYEIHSVSPQVVRIANMGTPARAFVLTQTIMDKKARSTARLIFSRYGNDYFISDIFWRDNSGRTTVKSPMELELAKNKGPAEIVSVPGQR
jgi:hypothetical protein